MFTFRLTWRRGALGVMAFCVVLFFAQVSHAQGTNLSLRFYGHGSSAPDLDRVKIAIDPAVPADVGATDFTCEFWLKAATGENSGSVTCNQDDGWITGNVVFDRDVFGNGDYGDFGVALNSGKIAFGVNNGMTGTTVCGATNVANGAWHHIAVTRNATTGEIRMFVDGQLDAQVASVTGNISYRDGRLTSYPNSDPFLVLGAEKHDVGAAYPAFKGWLDEVRLSNSIRYTANFTRPVSAFTPDGNTVALYHFNEGPAGACTGAILDASNASGGPSNGACQYGGAAPAGPVYTTDVPFGPPTAVQVSNLRVRGESTDWMWLILGGLGTGALALGVWWRRR
ncbi:MAG: LamG domain-containing protein [Chloroflexi bacterium]|nr:LamG domain-containing protein [Chloroflexota bacterium]